MRDAQSMLDQLVAFCGTQITEREVLDIFGFTAHETVSKLTTAVVEKRAVDALEVLHEQNSAGKDLTKLLSDLIVYLRNILVYQVDPANAVKDMADEIAAALEAQAQLIQTERLINIIDHFAEVDARMKWAPNKKMHFEVGIIKAVQSLRESNLSDVIAALSSAFPEEESSGEPSSPPVRRAAKVRSGGETVAAPLPPEERVASPESPGRQPPEEATDRPAPVSEPQADTDGGGPDVGIWRGLREKYPLAFAQAVFGGVEDGQLTVRFHPTDFCKEHALKQRKEIETFISKAAGRSLRLEVLTDEAVDVVNTAVEVPVLPKESGPGTNGAHAATSAESPPASEAPAPLDEKSFYEDRLIQDALEIFKGKLENQI